MTTALLLPPVTHTSRRRMTRDRPAIIMCFYQTLFLATFSLCASLQHTLLQMDASIFHVVKKSITTHIQVFSLLLKRNTQCKFQVFGYV